MGYGYGIQEMVVVVMAEYKGTVEKGQETGGRIGTNRDTGDGIRYRR